MAMLFSVCFDKENWDLVQIAFAGITGDKQHQKGLHGINAYLFGEGNKRGYITKADGQLIPSGYLMDSLFLSLDPYIRGVSGDTEGVAALLADAGIDATRSSSDLSDAERRKLSSLIASKLLRQGATKETLEGAVPVRYVLRNWNIDAETFASLLNSCGRSGKGSIGIGFGLGDRKCASQASDMDRDSRMKMLSAVRELDSGGLKQMDNIQFFDNTESGFTGMICETVMRFTGDLDKSTVGYSTSGGMTKASARCTHSILRKGVDLSAAMRAAGESAGGGGGGHMIASGAWFPSGNEKGFLDKLNEIIGEQISAR
jgi:RecJ-like exonuclease